MADRLVTIQEIAKKTGVSDNVIFSLIYKKKFPQPVHTKPYMFRVPDVNNWILEYGSQRISLCDVCAMLKLSRKKIDWSIIHYDFHAARTSSNGIHFWFRITILNWKKKHPCYSSYINSHMIKRANTPRSESSLIKKIMRQNK